MEGAGMVPVGRGPQDREGVVRSRGFFGFRTRPFLGVPAVPVSHFFPHRNCVPSWSKRWSHRGPNVGLVHRGRGLSFGSLGDLPERSACDEGLTARESSRASSPLVMLFGGLSGWFSGEWPRLSAFAVDGPCAPGWQAVAGLPLGSLLLLNTPALRISPRRLSFRSLRSTVFIVGFLGLVGFLVLFLRRGWGLRRFL